VATAPLSASASSLACWLERRAEVPPASPRGRASPRCASQLASG